MARRVNAAGGGPSPDPMYNSVLVHQLINKIMLDGKKSLARNIVYGAFGVIEERGEEPAVEVLDKAVKNVMPVLEVRPRRVGGATYQVPMEVRPERRTTLALRWIVRFARERNDKTMIDRLANELLDAAGGQGGAVRRREEMHRMAEANRAFAHYRW